MHTIRLTQQRLKPSMHACMGGVGATRDNTGNHQRLPVAQFAEIRGGLAFTLRHSRKIYVDDGEYAGAEEMPVVGRSIPEAGPDN